MVWIRLVVIKLMIIGGVWLVHWFLSHFAHHMLRHYASKLLPFWGGKRGQDGINQEAAPQAEVIEICPQCGYPQGQTCPQPADCPQQPSRKT